MNLLLDSQLEKISAHAKLHWKLRERYQDSKYPAQTYENAKRASSNLLDETDHIEPVLMWKWGHLGKDRYPASQQALVKEIETLWPRFVRFAKQDGNSWWDTFEFWNQELDPPTRNRFITKAFLAHIAHPREVPIIDRHNFNSLKWYLDYADVDIAGYSLRRPLPETPCKLDHIILLKSFLSELSVCTSTEEQELDKYMMMHGKSLSK